DARPAPVDSPVTSAVMAATKPEPSYTLYWALAGIFVFLGGFVWLLARRRRR
ncbi:MAG: LPXTG cell wall anchor domain-containing protein, partial [Chitinophagaceae bacterium]